MRTYVLISFALVLILTSVGCGQRNQNHKLVRWPDGTNDSYAIEAEDGPGHVVIIPNVRSVQSNGRYLIGRADWKYLSGFPTNQDGRLLTNEFLFVVDKHKDFPKCYMLITTNQFRWNSWCATNNISTNLQQVGRFVESVQSAPSYHGGSPRL